MRIRGVATRLRVRLIVVVLFTWSFVGARLARADQVDPDTEVAKRHFDSASAFYDAHDYVRALREFQEARIAKPLPALDFNIARCLDRLERYEEAIAAYKRFGIATPNASEVGEARERIEVLRARLEAKRQLDAGSAPNSLPPPPLPSSASPSVESPVTEKGAAPVLSPVARMVQLPPEQVVEESAPPRNTGGTAKPIYRRWWFWTVIGGVVVAGAAVGLAVGLAGSQGSTPACNDCGFGTLSFR